MYEFTISKIMIFPLLSFANEYVNGNILFLLS